MQKQMRSSHYPHSEPNPNSQWNMVQDEFDGRHNYIPYYDAGQAINAYPPLPKSQLEVTPNTTSDTSVPYPMHPNLPLPLHSSLHHPANTGYESKYNDHGYPPYTDTSLLDKAHIPPSMASGPATLSTQLSNSKHSHAFFEPNESYQPQPFKPIFPPPLASNEQDLAPMYSIHPVPPYEILPQQYLPNYDQTWKSNKDHSEKQMLPKHALGVQQRTLENEDNSDEELEKLLSKQTTAITRRKDGKWTKDDDEKLKKFALLREKSKKTRKVKWSTIADQMGEGKDAGACQRRWNKVIMPGLSKGHWSEREDNILREKAGEYLQKGQRIQWCKVASYIEGRIGKQCRERWENKLRPDLRNEEWTEEEDILCVKAFREHGNKWKKIATYVPGRSENTVKNRLRSERFWSLLHVKLIEESSAKKSKELGESNSTNVTELIEPTSVTSPEIDQSTSTVNK